MTTGTPTLYGHEHPTTMEPQKEERIGHVLHHVKVWPVFFEKLQDGTKPWEVRKNDRDYRVGYVLDLQEWNPSKEAFTGRSVQRVIIDVYAGGQFGIEDGHVVLGLENVSRSVWHYNVLKQFTAWLATQVGDQYLHGAERVFRTAVGEYCDNNRIPRP
jgi:hypothetical protein